MDKINIDYEKNIIITVNNLREWKDITTDIKYISKAMYYGNHSGYNVWFKNSNEKFFYPSRHLHILNFIKIIETTNKIIVLNNEFIRPLKIEQFEFDFYRITTIKGQIVVNSLELKDAPDFNIFSYYEELAKYAGEITTDEEPLYFLSKNYEKIKPKFESVLLDYIQGKSTKRVKNLTPIIVPFEFNKSQYDAISNAFQYSISVIEGPPGTGKTQTILNLISNIISRGHNCAVVSNNNSAVDNVFEKLTEEKIDFLAAQLGSKAYRESFFENIDNTPLKNFLDSYDGQSSPTTLKRIEDLTKTVQQLQQKELELASIKNELNELLTEEKNFNSQYSSLITISSRYQSIDILKLISKLEKPKKLNFFERWILRIKYKIKYKFINLNDLIMSLESTYYIKQKREIELKIFQLEKYFESINKTSVYQELKNLSEQYLLEKIYSLYKNYDLKEFTVKSYQYDYTNFLKRYPIILSTSQSLLNSAPNGFLFDYLIIDEASQGDLLSSVLAMSCAKNIVVVGDSRQLQQIDEARLFGKSDELAQKYQISSTYIYKNNSILKSIKNSIKGVPVTLLREHYRCAPDIINFCNKMFYDGELIPMTKNTSIHIKIIKTQPGNHSRKNPNGSGQYNQREIDEVLHLISNKDCSHLGIITPFRYQAEQIKKQSHIEALESDTIHKFQGRQKSEVVLSFVVNSIDQPQENIENKLYDFITNKELLNVAITRGKNLVTAIVSDGVYNSKNNIIHDFIRYTENLYDFQSIYQSNISSVFDYLYFQKTNHMLSHSKISAAEILIKNCLDEILQTNSYIGYSMHTRLSKLIFEFSNFTIEQQKYLRHPWTHVDFLIYNKVTKEPLFVVEVDGIKYHEKQYNQLVHDEWKDLALTSNNIPIYRLKTNESNEYVKLKTLIDQYKY